MYVTRVLTSGLSSINTLLTHLRTDRGIVEVTMSEACNICFQIFPRKIIFGVFFFITS